MCSWSLQLFKTLVSSRKFMAAESDHFFHGKSCHFQKTYWKRISLVLSIRLVISTSILSCAKSLYTMQNTSYYLQNDNVFVRRHRSCSNPTWNFLFDIHVSLDTWILSFLPLDNSQAAESWTYASLFQKEVQSFPQLIHTRASSDLSPSYQWNCPASCFLTSLMLASFMTYFGAQHRHLLLHLKDIFFKKDTFCCMYLWKLDRTCLNASATMSKIPFIFPSFFFFWGVRWCA